MSMGTHTHTYGICAHPAGKVVDRHWYNRNKHIFPASRWEVFDFETNYETYTTHGHEVR